MFLLILGLALFWAVHLYKRMAPDHRVRLGRAGMAATGIGSLLSLLLIIVGYRIAEGPFWWGPSPALVGINNLLMLIAFYLLACWLLKTRLTTRLRQPLLLAVMLWAVAHLLVNGDLPSLVLFGGILIWAPVQWRLIERSGARTPPAGPFPMSREIGALIAAPLLMGGVGMIHGWLGYWPFGG